MSIRMPSTIQTRQMLLGLQRIQDRMATNTLRVSSGQQITNPGDDPTGAAAIVDFSSSIEANSQFQKQADAALSFLQSSEGVVSSVTNTVTSLQELAQQGLNGTTGPSGRAAIATQVDSILTNLLSLANTKVQGKYLFAGRQTQTQPFSGPAAGPITYAGDGGLINLDVAVGTSVTTNLPGDALFFGTGGQGSATDLFQAVTDLRDGLNADNTAQIQTAYNNLKSILGTFSQAQTDLGGRQSGLMDLQSILSGFNLTLQGLQNKVQDTNYPETLTQLSSDTTVQSATLSTLAKANQQSLFNYLG